MTPGGQNGQLLRTSTLKDVLSPATWVACAGCVIFLVLSFLFCKMGAGGWEGDTILFTSEVILRIE